MKILDKIMVTLFIISTISFISLCALAVVQGALIHINDIDGIVNILGSKLYHIYYEISNVVIRLMIPYLVILFFSFLSVMCIGAIFFIMYLIKLVRYKGKKKRNIVIWTIIFVTTILLVTYLICYLLITYCISTTYQLRIDDNADKIKNAILQNEMNLKENYDIKDIYIRHVLLKRGFPNDYTLEVYIMYPDFTTDVIKTFVTGQDVSKEMLENSIDMTERVMPIAMILSLALAGIGIATVIYLSDYYQYMAGYD
ncbi:MAG: hypothetical protein Q4D02_02390 [Clostridia bacterium]|nr:hypothetical protein [Clostridia bacterium]